MLHFHPDMGYLMVYDKDEAGSDTSYGHFFMIGLSSFFTFNNPIAGMGPFIHALLGTSHGE